MGRAKLTSLKNGTVVELDVVSKEEMKAPTDVTSLPVEDGRKISDHAELKPQTASLDGVITGDTSGTKLNTLLQWRDERHRLRYSGRRVITNYVIKELSTDYDAEIGDGFAFSLKLQQVRIVSAATTEPISVTTQTKQTESRGFVQPVQTTGLTPMAAGAAYASPEQYYEEASV